MVSLRNKKIIYLDNQNICTGVTVADVIRKEKQFYKVVYIHALICLFMKWLFPSNNAINKLTLDFFFFLFGFYVPFKNI